MKKKIVSIFLISIMVLSGTVMSFTEEKESQTNIKLNDSTVSIPYNENEIKVAKEENLQEVKATTVDAKTNEKIDISPRYEECACGGRVHTKKTGESSWGRGQVAICKDGLNGNIWKKTIYFESYCNTCGYSQATSEVVTELRCAHPTA